MVNNPFCLCSLYLNNSENKSMKLEVIMNRQQVIDEIKETLGKVPGFIQHRVLDVRYQGRVLVIFISP